MQQVNNNPLFHSLPLSTHISTSTSTSTSTLPSSSSTPLPLSLPLLPPSPSPFLLCVSGRPVLFDSSCFQCVSFDSEKPLGSKWLCNLTNPANIHEFTVAITTPQILTNNNNNIQIQQQGNNKCFGVGLYYSVSPFNEWQYVGCLTLDYPTATFRAPWKQQIPLDTPLIQLGLSVEEVTFLSQLQPADQKEEERTLESAKGIAQDLYQFMASFAQNTGAAKQFGDVLIIPTNCIDKWMEKFLAKHKRDPYFWIKKRT